MTEFRTLATGAPRLGFGVAGFGNFNVSFVNVAAVDVKLDEERRVTLDIERHGRVLESFDVVDGYRPALDVTVTERCGFISGEFLLRRF